MGLEMRLINALLITLISWLGVDKAKSDFKEAKQIFRHARQIRRLRLCLKRKRKALEDDLC